MIAITGNPISQHVEICARAERCTKGGAPSMKGVKNIINIRKYSKKGRRGSKRKKKQKKQQG